MNDTQSRALFAQAQRFIAGGVNSPSRSYAAVGGGTPRFMEHGAGAYLYDVDGNRYIDYLCAYGALILGHAHPRIAAAVAEGIKRGSVYGTPNPLEVAFASKLCALMPSLDMIRFTVSGTEAVMTAIRLARGYTGRAKILKFAGSYHGHSDLVLVSAGSGSSTLDIEDSIGVPAAVKADVVNVPFNNEQALRQAVAEHGDSLAAALVEPVVGNFGIVPPEPGYLQLLHELMHGCGALVIWDEVITAFRYAYGSVQQVLEKQSPTCRAGALTPDIITLGKIIGGGLPIGAYGARREIMELVAPLGGVYQDGTLAGNPLSMAAGLACIEALGEEGLYDRLARYAHVLAEAARAAGVKHSIPTHVGEFGGSLSIQFTSERVIDFDGCNRSSSQLFGRFFHLMLEQGILLAPSKYEALFISTTHTEADIDYTAQAIDRAFATMAKEA